ncbi:hypothetical protein BG004_003753 [Podila humilis]|nr:hypothetical protein BG004_003753 [Podila humilis]
MSLQTRRRIVAILAVIVFVLCLQFQIDLNHLENMITTSGGVLPDLMPPTPKNTRITTTTTTTRTVKVLETPIISVSQNPIFELLNNSNGEDDDDDEDTTTSHQQPKPILRQYQQQQDPFLQVDTSPSSEDLPLALQLDISQIPKPKTLLQPGTRYLAYMPYAGLTNQFMALEKAAFIARRLNRTLVIPPIIHSSHDSHHNRNQRWSDFFDLVQFSTKTNIKIIEWDDLRPLTPEQSFIGQQKAKLSRKKSNNNNNSYEPWDRLAEDLPCQIIYGFGGSEPLHSSELTFTRQFLFRPRFIAPPPPPPPRPGTTQDSRTIVNDRAAIGVKDNDNPEDIVTMNDLIDRFSSHPNIENEHHDDDDSSNNNTAGDLLFLSHTFKLRDPVQESNSIIHHHHQKNNQIWEEIGQHLHFRRKVNEYAARLLRHRIPELGGHGRYIAIHIRRGDIWQKCRESSSSLSTGGGGGGGGGEGMATTASTPPSTTMLTEADEDRATMMMKCVTPFGHFAEAVERARGLAQENRLAVIVTTDSKSSEDHQTIARLGWRRLNHELYITEQELGVFGPAMVDAAILANADYFIGTYKSTMSKVAAQRQYSWHQREAMYPRTTPSWVPDSA